MSVDNYLLKQGELKLNNPNVDDHNKPKMTPLALMYLLSMYEHCWYNHLDQFKTQSMFHTRMSQLMLLEYVKLDETGLYSITVEGCSYICKLLHNP